MLEIKNIDCIPKNFTGKCKTKDTGTILYYLNGKLHRTDGPAIECASGYKYWFIENKEYSEEEFNALPEVIMYKAGLGMFL